MELRVENLVKSIRILAAAVAFLIVVTVGAIVQADPFRLLAASLFAYCFFYVLAAIVTAILSRLNQETSDERLTRRDGKKESENELGRLIDLSQEAELPVD